MGAPRSSYIYLFFSGTQEFRARVLPDATRLLLSKPQKNRAIRRLSPPRGECPRYAMATFKAIIITRRRPSAAHSLEYIYIRLIAEMRRVCDAHQCAANYANVNGPFCNLITNVNAVGRAWRLAYDARARTCDPKIRFWSAKRHAWRRVKYIGGTWTFYLGRGGGA